MIIKNITIFGNKIPQYKNDTLCSSLQSCARFSRYLKLYDTNISNFVSYFFVIPCLYFVNYEVKNTHPC